MLYKLENEIEKQKAVDRFKLLLDNKQLIELKQVTNNRSQQQNKALHVYYTLISAELNDKNMEYQYTGITGNIFELRYTPDLVKNFVWRPIQIALFDIKSTTKINTQQINDIIDVISNFFADREIVIEFPSIDSLLNK